MRVLHVIPSVSVADGGPSRAIAVMEKALSAAGISVVTVTTDDDGPSCCLRNEDRPAEFHGAKRFYMHKWTDHYKFAPAIIPWLKRHVREFDVLHIHALFSFSSIAAAIMAEYKGVPYVIRPLGTLTNYGMRHRRPIAKRLSLSLLESRILKNAAAVHFTSHAELREARTLGIPMREVVIPLGIDAPSVKTSSTLLRKYPILTNHDVILYLSRLDPKKNLEALLEAFALLEPAENKLVLLVAGSGDPGYTANLRSLAANLNVSENVIWLGHVEHEMKAAAFASADIFVLPSLSENFGLAAAEALYAELPCVLGQGVAIAAEVQASRAGLIVDPTPQNLANAVDRLVCDKVLRFEMGAAGKDLAIKLFSTSVMAARLKELYNKVATPVTPSQAPLSSPTNRAPWRIL